MDGFMACQRVLPCRCCTIGVGYLGRSAASKPLMLRCQRRNTARVNVESGTINGDLRGFAGTSDGIYLPPV
jgi:hypothetical protein